MRRCWFSLGSVVLFLSLMVPAVASAQKAVGVVTALRGKGQLTRAGTQTALRFKDDVILRDIVDTQDKSLARILFGGKSTVTVRELSRLEVREETLPTGAVRSIHELSSGGILVHVARGLLRPGDEVQIRTPNAVVAVRGTTLFAQFIPQLARTVFTLLSGSAVVTPQGLPSITLTPNTAVNVTGNVATGVQTGLVEAVSQSAGNAILQESEARVAVTKEDQGQSVQAQTEQAAHLASAVVEAVTGEVATTSPETQQLAQETAQQIDTATADPTTTTEQTVAAAPVTAGGTGETITQAAQQPKVSLSGVTQDLGSGGALFTFDGELSSTATPFIQIRNSTITQGGSNLIVVSPGANATLAGQLADATDSDLSTGGNFLDIKGSLKGTGANPFVQFDPSTLDVGNHIVKINPGGTLDVAGALFQDVNGLLVSADVSLVEADDGSIIGRGSAPFVQFDGSKVEAGNRMIGLQNGSSMTVAGPLLEMTDVDLDISGGSTVRLTGGSTLTNTAGPVIKISGGSLQADALAISDSSGNTFDLTGTLLDLTNTTVTLRVLGEEIPDLDLDNFTHTLAANEPIFRLNNSTLKLTGTTDKENLVSLESEEIGPTFAGLAVVATNSTITNSAGALAVLEGTFSTTSTSPLAQITGSTVSTTSTEPLFAVLPPVSPGSTDVTMAGPLASMTNTTISGRDFFIMDGTSTLASNTTDPFIQLNGGTLTGTGDFLFSGSESKLNMAGTLLRSQSSNLSIDANLFEISGGGQLKTNSDDPLTLLIGGIHTIGNSLFRLVGINTDPVTGLGTDQPIKGSSTPFSGASNPIGALFKATDGADIDVTGSGAIGLDVDTALLEATLPVVELVGSSSAQTKITANNTFLDFFKSKVVALGPVIALDKGLITVTNGPLLNLKGGTNIEVTGNLFKLINGSKINVVNGPAIAVDGSGTSLNVSGALLNFGNTSGNQFIINNTISPTATLSGIPVSKVTGGSVSIGPNPVVNDAGGNTTSFTGSVISTTNGGTVNIIAP